MSQNPAVFQKWCEDAKDGLSNHLAENVIKRCKLTQKCICECVEKIGFFGLKNVISTTHITTFNKYESFITSEEQAKNYLLWIYDLSIPSSQSEENKISSSEDMEKKMRARCNFRMAEYFGDELFPDLFRNFFDYAQYVANLICNNNNNHDNRNKNDKLFSIIKKKFILSVLNCKIDDFRQAKPTPLICKRSVCDKTRTLNTLLKQEINEYQVHNVLQNKLGINIDEFPKDLDIAKYVMEELVKEEIENYNRTYEDNRNNNDINDFASFSSFPSNISTSIEEFQSNGDSQSEDFSRINNYANNNNNNIKKKKKH